MVEQELGQCGQRLAPLRLYARRPARRSCVVVRGQASRARRESLRRAIYDRLSLRLARPQPLCRHPGAFLMLTRVDPGPAVVVCSTCRHSREARDDGEGVRGGARLVAAMKRLQAAEPRYTGIAVPEMS